MGTCFQDVWPVAEYQQTVYFFFLWLVVEHISFFRVAGLMEEHSSEWVR